MSNSTTSALASGYRRAGSLVGTRSRVSVSSYQQQTDTPERVPSGQGTTDQISTARF